VGRKILSIKIALSCENAPQSTHPNVTFHKSPGDEAYRPHNGFMHTSLEPIPIIFPA